MRGKKFPSAFRRWSASRCVVSVPTVIESEIPKNVWQALARRVC